MPESLDIEFFPKSDAVSSATNPNKARVFSEQRNSIVDALNARDDDGDGRTDGRKNKIVLEIVDEQS